jgi:hypothetical protein
MAFYDHLSADEDIRIPASKLPEDPTVTFLAPGAVKIHAESTDPGKFFLKSFLDLLGPD